MYPPTAKPIPSTRPTASAWLDTSITTAPHLAARARRPAAPAGRSPPVWSARWPRTRSPSRVSTVPIRPVTSPAARSPDSTRYAVEVFPAVPVMPIIGEPGRRVAVDGRRGRAEHRPWVVGDQHRQPGGQRRRTAGRVGQHGHRAGRGGVGDELRAVPVGAGQRRVEVAGTDLAAVVGDAGDLGVRAGQRRRQQRGKRSPAGSGATVWGRGMPGTASDPTRCPGTRRQRHATPAPHGWILNFGGLVADGGTR